MTTAPSPIPEHAQGSLAARQRDAIGRLVTMLATRAEQRAAIDTARDEALAAAESGHAAARRAADETAEAAREQNEHERDTALRSINEKLDLQAAEAQRAHEIAREDAVERLDSELRMAEEKLRDAAWLAEASFEGGAEQPKLELERIRGIVREEFGKLDTIEAHARRLAGPRVAFPASTPTEQDQADADATGDMQTALADLATAREAANDGLKKLRGVTLHAFVRSGGPIVMILLGAAGGAAWHITENGLSALPMTGAYTLAGGAALLVVAWPVRALALAGTRKKVAPLAEYLRLARASGVAAIRKAEAHKREVEKTVAERKNAEVAAGRQKYETRLAVVRQRREQTLTRLDRKHVVIMAEIKKRRTGAAQEINDKADERAREIEQTHAAALAEADEARDRALAEAERARDDAQAALDQEFAAILEDAVARTNASTDAMSVACPDWDDDAWPEGPARSARHARCP